MNRLRSALGNSKWFDRLTHPYARKAMRVGRTVALGGAIYGAGYAGGIHQAINDPEGTTRQVLTQVLASTGKDSKVLPADSAVSQYVTRLGGEIIIAAQQLVGEEVEKRAAVVARSDPHRQADAPPDEELERLTDKLRALHRNWRFVVIDNGAVNAFVTDMLPGYVFIHRGLLELLKGKPEQLSFILGHELSHYLMEHGTSDRNLQFGLSMLQVRHHRVAGHGTTV